MLVLFIAFLLAGVAALAYWGLRQGQIVEEGRHFWTLVLYGTAGSAIALLAYLIVKLGFARGTVGDNRFGPDPLAPDPNSSFDQSSFSSNWKNRERDEPGR